MKTKSKSRKHRKRTRTQKAGMKIGRNSRQFIVDPAIPCKDKDTKEYVSKVFVEDNPHIQPNKDVIAKIKEIPKYENYFLLPEYCEPGELSEINKEDGVTDENKHRSYWTKRGGKDTLRKYCEDMVKGREYFTQREVISFLTKDLHNVFEGLVLLHDKNIIHGDLHTENVLEWGTSNTFRIIDFDTTFSLEDVEHRKQWYHPPSDDEAKSEEWAGIIEEIATILKPNIDIINVLEKVYDHYYPTP